MTESDIRLPDNSWFDGQVASWEGNRFGYRALFEAIVDPTTFREVCNSAGDDELIELFDPSEHGILSITLLDESDTPLSDPMILSEEMPATILPRGSRFILDATASIEPFAYTCTLYGEKPLRLESFRLGEKNLPITYLESLFIKDGVECDVYKFDDDDTRDLGVVKVAKGSSTPLQRVVGGDLTVEGHLSGDGVLVVARMNGNKEHYSFTAGSPSRPVEVNRGDTMQWTAREDLVFYEVCEPPYTDGRFEDLY